ncbi:MAG: hypothetical protein ACI89Z_000473 [Porticoccus sp.]|jgi:hypothetical protein
MIFSISVMIKLWTALLGVLTRLRELKAQGKTADEAVVAKPIRAIRCDLNGGFLKT